MVQRDKAGGDVVGRDQFKIEHADFTTPEKSDARLVYSRNQLRTPNSDFVGRVEIIEGIKVALRSGGAAVTASVEGMGGVGKTETALVAAHELVGEGRFKDAQIFIDLHGFTPGAQPKAHVEALSELLRPFVPPHATLLPDTAEALLPLWRQATAGLDMLLFLDNGRNEAQVEPLLPGHDGCVAIITSRNKLQLGGLTPIGLDEMAPGEAVDLALALANRRDAGRLSEAQAEKLAELCGYLPLAIEIAANTLSVAQGWDAVRFLAALADRSRTFELLKRGDRNLKATLAVGLETLDAETRARWQALGVFEGGFIGASACAVWDAENPDPTLADLEGRSLVTFDKEAHRFRLHDFLRALALDELGEDAKRDMNMRRRHAAHYFAVLQLAEKLYNQGHDAVAKGLALLDRELGNIRAGQRWAAARADGDDDAAVLAMRYPNFACLQLRVSPDENILWLDAALSAALRMEDREAEAMVRGNLGVLYGKRGELDRAEEMYRNALAIDEDLGHKEGMANQYGNLGILYLTKGELDQAEEMFHKALAIDEDLGRKEGMASHYGNLGILYRRRGELDRAREMYRKSLAIEEDLGRKEGMASDYGNLGILYADKGELDQAEEMYQKSLTLFRELGAADRIAQVERLLRKIGGGKGSGVQQPRIFWGNPFQKRENTSIIE